MEFLLTALLRALDLVFGLDPEVWYIAATSLGISLAATGLAALAAMPLALVVHFTRFTGRRLLLGVLNTLRAMPTVVVGLLLYGLLTRTGPLGGWEWLYTRSAILLGQFVLITPMVWNLMLTAFAAADPRIDATCRLLGASRPQRGYMLLSEARFAVLAAVIVGFGRAISEVGISILLGGNIKGFTRTLTSAIAMETSRGEFEFALALGLLLLLIAFVVTYSLQRLARIARPETR